MITVEFKRVGIKPGFKVLDIGCGSGRHVCAAYQHYDVTAVGADINFDDLSEAITLRREMESQFATP